MWSGLQPLNLAAWITLAITGLILSTRGFALGNFDIGFLGIALTFASISGALTWRVKTDHQLKRTAEVILLFGAFGTIVYGYFSTGSTLLAALTALITVLISVGFMLSYVLPKIRSRLGKV